MTTVKREVRPFGCHGNDHVRSFGCHGNDQVRPSGCYGKNHCVLSVTMATVLSVVIATACELVQFFSAKEFKA